MKDATEEHDEGRRVIKLSLHRLARGNKILISSIEKLVLMNSQIAVRGAMIMNHLAVYCTANNVPLPKIDQALLYNAFNYDPRLGTDSIKNEHLRNVVEQSINIIPRPTHDDGCSRGNLIDNLVRLYLANIKASIKGKWYSIIKNSINTHLKIYHQDLTKKETKAMWSKIYKHITRPLPADCSDSLDGPALELVKFHRDGFGVDNEGWVNDIFVNDLISTSDGITQVISHFSKCLHRQSTSQSDFLGNENCLKKQMALPEFHIGRISILIDQKGLYYLVKQYMEDSSMAFEVPGGANGFGVELFVKWLKKLFYIGESIDLHGKRDSCKMIKWEGVVISTDGVKASLHYFRQNGEADAMPPADGVKPTKPESHVNVDDNGKMTILFMMR